MQFSTSTLLSIIATLSSFTTAAPAQKAAPLQVDFNVIRYGVSNSSYGAQKSVLSAINLNLANEYSLYLAEIQVGTPGQTLQVDVDTGSSDLWIPAIGTKASSGTFNASSSSSFSKISNDFKIGYGDGSHAFGDWATENVNIGGAHLKDIRLGYATNQTVGRGLLGVGMVGNEASNVYNNITYPNFPAQLKDQGIINKNAYSLYLNSLDAKAGSILFGGVDHAKYEEELKTLDLVNIDDEGEKTSSPVAFFVNLDGISQGETSFTNDASYPALLDSGTTLIYAPSAIATAIGEKFGTKVPFFDAYVTSCNKQGEDVEFTFGDKTIKVPFSNLLYQINGKSNKPMFDECLIGVMPSKDNSYILGDAFLRSAYVLYNIEDNQVGISQAKYTTASDIELL